MTAHYNRYAHPYVWKLKYVRNGNFYVNVSTAPIAYSEKFIFQESQEIVEILKAWFTAPHFLFTPAVTGEGPSEENYESFGWQITVMPANRKL